MRKSRSRVGIGRLVVGETQSWGGEDLGGVVIVWGICSDDCGICTGLSDVGGT